MPVITFNLNGNPVSVDADNDEELLWVLRDRMDVKGLKYGWAWACAAPAPATSTAWPAAHASRR
jgi:aerobic-type carbon monoxide dehydrogenase small subunit (CoxS/CutS family)